MICYQLCSWNVAGLKPGQRKVLFTFFKRKQFKEVKVAQVAGAVSEQSAYHHGEVRSEPRLIAYS